MCIIERKEGRNIQEMARNDITPPIQLIKQGFYAFILVDDNYFSKKRQGGTFMVTKRIDTCSFQHKYDAKGSGPLKEKEPLQHNH